MSKKLDAREKRFVEEYLIDLDVERSALAAGYAASTARTKAFMWVSNGKQKPHVYDAIKKAMEKRSKRTEITAEAVLAELGKIGFANMLDYVRIGSDGDPFIDLSELTREQAAAISEATVEDFTDGRGEDSRNVRKVKIKLSDKKSALETIGKHLGMFVDISKVEVTQKGPLVIVRKSKEVEDE